MEKWDIPRRPPLWSFLLYVVVGQFLLADRVVGSAVPCILQTNGTLNSTALSIYKAKGQFMNGVLYASDCAQLPSTICTNLSSLSNGSRFCVMQLTGTCFCPIATIFLRPKTVPLTADVLMRLALQTKCLPDFYPSLPNCLGDQLCQNITATMTQDAQQAKALIIALQPYYPCMRCIRSLAHASSFKWTPDELMNLTRGLQSNDVSDILTLISGLKKNPTSLVDLSSMTGEALLGQPPSTIRNILAAVTALSKTSFLRQYTDDLQQAKKKVLSQIGTSLTDRSTIDKLMSDVRRPSPTDIAVSDVFRPLTNVSVNDINALMSDSTLVGCFGDGELKQVPTDIICNSLVNGSDPFRNLTAFQQRTIREHCLGVFSANGTMPPSLGARASLSEISAECQNKTFDALKIYLEQFSNVDSTLSVSQNEALAGCLDKALIRQKYMGLDSKTVRMIRVALRYVPVERILQNFITQADKDNYCQQMAAGPFLSEQKRNVLAFCLNQTQIPICDYNDLLNELLPSDVDLLQDDGLMSGITVFARKVSNRATRRKILDRILKIKEGFANFTADDFKATAGFAIDMTEGEVTSLESNVNFGFSFAAIVSELSDQEVRVSLGEHGPEMQTQIDTAKASVIPAVLAASQAATGSKPSRKKRDTSTTWGIWGCQSVIAPASWPVAELNNLSNSVFTSCPSALNVDGYMNEQVSAIAQLAVKALGDPCMWNRTQEQQLGVIVFGLDPRNISCMDFNDTQTIMSIGGRRTLHPLDTAKYQAVYNRWSSQTGNGKLVAMTAELITTIGIVSCGMTYTLMTSTEYDKASKFIGGIDCYSPSILKTFARFALTLYGNGSTINISAIASIGTVVAGMDASFFRDLSPEKVSAIMPGAIWLISPSIIANLTLDQIKAFTAAQAIALNDTQLQSLNGTAMFDIIMQKRKMTINSTSTVSPLMGATTGAPLTALPATGTNSTMNGTAIRSGDVGNSSITPANGSAPSTAVPPKNAAGTNATMGGTNATMGGTNATMGGTNASMGGTATPGGVSPGNSGLSGSGGTGNDSVPQSNSSVTAKVPSSNSNASSGGSGSDNAVSTKQPSASNGTNNTQAAGGSGGSGGGSGGVSSNSSSNSGSATSNPPPASMNSSNGANLVTSNSGASATPKLSGVGDTTLAPAGGYVASTAVAPAGVASTGVPPAGDASKLPPSQTTPPPPPPTQAIPAVINQDNIMNYVNRLGPDLSSDELAKRLQPDALNNSNVLRALAGQSLTDNQIQVLRNKFDQLQAKPGAIIDPSVLASAGSLISPKTVQKLLDPQILAIVKQTFFPQNRETASLYGPRVGQLLLGTGNTLDFNAKLLDSQKAVPGILVTDFMSAIKNRPINNDSLVNFTDVMFTEQQARLLYAKFSSDNPSVVATKMIAPLLRNLIDTLPKSVKQAVPPDSVKNFDGPTAADVIPEVSSSHGVTELIDPAATRDFLPVEKRLYEKVRNYGFDKLADKQLINLVYSGLLTVEAVKLIGTKLCNVVNLPSVAGYNPVLALRPPVVGTIYQICKPVLGQFCSGPTDRYSLLSVGATASDILAITDDNALFNYCIPNICQMMHIANSAQIDALLTLVRAHLDKKVDLGDQFQKISCLLPYLGARYLNQTNDKMKRVAICGLIACQPCLNVPSSIVREAMDYCISINVSIKTFTCPEGRGRCLMETMNKDYPSHSNITCGPAAVDAVDRLQASVMDCALRAELYGCIKGQLDLTDANSLAQLASLVDQFSDADWKTIPNKNLCGLLGIVSKVWTAWDSFQAGRASQGLRPVALCTNRAAVLAKLLAADASTDCTGNPTKRRKRDTAALTCDQVNEMGPSVTQLSPGQLQTLSPKDFTNCAQFLGRVIGFTSDQWKALASVAKQTSVYGTDCSKWITEQITSAAGIVTGLSDDEISTLPLNDLNAIQAAGSNGLWSADQLIAAFECVTKNYKNDNVANFSSAELSSLSNIICGATVGEINSMQAKEVCGAVEEIGELHTCEDQQLMALVSQAKVCLGSDVTKWLPSDINNIGSLIGGLTKTDISALSQAQIQAISGSSIPEIPPITFSGFTAVQLGYFSTYQAAVITPAQYQSLDQTRQAVLQQKLSSISDDIALNPSASRKSVCSPLSASLLPLITAPLAFLLRI